jgi:NADH dehydrogenase
VSEDDVAAFGIAAVNHPDAINQHLPIGGPQALSWRDVVGVYQRVLGRPIEMRFVAPGAPIPGIPQSLLPLLANFDTYDTDFDTEPLARKFGVRLTPLEDIARTMIAAGTAGQ